MVCSVGIDSIIIQLFARVYFAIKKTHHKPSSRSYVLTSIIGKKELNIMLADDDEDDREVFLEAIKDIAPNVKLNVCEDGSELMKLLNKEGCSAPDIIFLDLNMPRKDGHECLREIRDNKKLQHIPIIIYSTSTNRDHIEDTFLNGANFYFPKPDSYRDLKAVMRKIFDFDWDMFMKPQKTKFVLSINKLK